MDSDDINVWQEIIDNVFYDNYVKGDPTKFLNALEKTLKENGYSGPINPERPNNFGNPGGEYFDRLKKNYKAIQGLESDKQNRPLDRYIMDDILVNKFFNGDVSSAGKFYQEWLKTRGEYWAHKHSNGSENNMFKNIEDIPVWTPNTDVVKYHNWGYMFDHLFGGKYYESHETQDKKRKDDEEYYKNRDEGKYRDVCPRCSSNDKMPWVSSDADYPKGMIKKSEVCKRCSPEGEKPSKMYGWSYGYYCPICENPSSPGIKDESHYSYNDIIKTLEYWKNKLEYEKKQAERMTNNPEEYKTYLASLNGRPVNGEEIEKVQKNIDYFERLIYKPGQKCDCSFEKLKDVYDRYVQFEDYESLENMKKNKLYNWFFDELNKNQNLTESIQRIKSIMKLL